MITILKPYRMEMVKYSLTIFAIFFILGIRWNIPFLPCITVILPYLNNYSSLTQPLFSPDLTVIPSRLNACSYPAQRLFFPDLMVILSRLNAYSSPARQLFFPSPILTISQPNVYSCIRQDLDLTDFHYNPTVGWRPPIVSPP